jgi:hypothetical protein
VTPRRSHQVQHRESTGPRPLKPIEGALDRLAPIAEEAARQAGFFAGSTEAGLHEKGRAARGYVMWKNETAAVYYFPRGVVKVGVQSGTVVTEARR